jgi:hypothetical protein
MRNGGKVMRFIFALVVVLVLALVVADHAFAQGDETAAIKGAVEKSLPLLQSVGLPFIEQTGCTSCHHNTLPAMAVALARERGFKVDERLARENAESTLRTRVKGRERIFQQEIGRRSSNFVALPFVGSYTLLGLAAEKQPPDKTTDAIVHHLAREQAGDGHWRSQSNRPPMGYSEITATAVTIRALQLYAPKGRAEEFKKRIERAQAWLVRTIPASNEERTFQLLGLGWAGASRKDVEKAVKGLLAEQRADGGWAQLPTLESDAYATGEALAALHQAGGLSVSDPAYRRGVRFLLKTQLNDGSWLVKSRSFPVQRYFESGFPHGANQWISAAGTSWATMALALASPPIKEKP